jgi:hypothetical protein
VISSANSAAPPDVYLVSAANFVFSSNATIWAAWLDASAMIVSSPGVRPENVTMRFFILARALGLSYDTVTRKKIIQLWQELDAAWQHKDGHLETHC